MDDHIMVQTDPQEGIIDDLFSSTAGKQNFPEWARWVEGMETRAVRDLFESFEETALRKRLRDRNIVFSDFYPFLGFFGRAYRPFFNSEGFSRR